MTGDQQTSQVMLDGDIPWRKTLTRYHWFVLIVAALGWLFDTMDQQLFALARAPAMKELVTSKEDEPSVAREKVSFFGGLATSIFLIGWATGGIGFGILGDRIGRAKTMVLTILVYSLFTGLSAFSVGFWDFVVWRFLAGLGVGGEFAVGVALVAEVMPDRARPHALGMLQAFSAVGNITAAVVSIVLGDMEQRGVVASGWDWRIMFLIGTAPAFLAILIMRRLKEPERWQALKDAGKAVGGPKLGSYAELFGDPRWRRRAIVGVILASSGVIGLWGIVFFSYDLTRSVFRKTFEEEYREERGADKDFKLVAAVYNQLNPSLPPTSDDEKARLANMRKTYLDLPPDAFLNATPDDHDTQSLVKAMQAVLRREGADQGALSDDSLREELLKSRRSGKSQQESAEEVDTIVRRLNVTSRENYQSLDKVQTNLDSITVRKKQIDGRLTFWAGVTSVMLNLGGAIGIYFFSRLTHRFGRRAAFAISFLLAMFSTMAVFWYLNRITDIFWMIPIMGFCQLALFGGYAIYFPELFPTRLRSSGVSFCYNVGRYIAAIGPSALGFLTSQVFTEAAGYKEPMRYAGIVMCSVFLIGLLALPFAPETKGQPLPE